MMLIGLISFIAQMLLTVSAQVKIKNITHLFLTETQSTMFLIGNMDLVYRLSIVGNNEKKKLVLHLEKNISKRTYYTYIIMYTLQTYFQVEEAGKLSVGKGSRKKKFGCPATMKERGEGFGGHKKNGSYYYRGVHEIGTHSYLWPRPKG